MNDLKQDYSLKIPLKNDSSNSEVNDQSLKKEPYRENYFFTMCKIEKKGLKRLW